MCRKENSVTKNVGKTAEKILSVSQYSIFAILWLIHDCFDSGLQLTHKFDVLYTKLFF